MINLLKNNKFNIFLLFVYSIITIVLLMHHEMWRDETQVWCLIRDCNIAEFFKIIRIEGHPLLWYTLLFPFVKLGFSAITMQIIGLIISILAVGYIVFKSPFDNITKFFIIFSSAMVYFYPVVVRNLVLIPILIFILANLYQSRKEQPYKYCFTLLLLSNTHFLILCFCFITSLLFIFETIKERNKKALIPIAIFLLNCTYLYLFYNNTLSDSQSYYTYSHNTMPFLMAIKTFAMMFFQYPFIYPQINIAIFYILSIGILIRFYVLNKKLFTVLLFSFAAHFYIYYKVWFNGIISQKAYILLFILLFCYWIQTKERKDKILNYIVLCVFIINSIFTVFNFNFEMKYNYSSAKQTADFIKTNLSNEEVICTIGYPYLFTSISAYLPDRKFYSVYENKYTSYYDFSRRKIMSNIKAPNCKYYILQKTVISEENYKPIFQSDNIVLSGIGHQENEQETFDIYERE